ncbi:MULTISPECIES: prealbumin-like fold domain-containing protein [Nocardia]|uniref:prealbumin-like fold domain-containing protein n=1 Tax=Nocardia TaxID=1817 RepID=UPI001895B973|nr:MULTISPECIES: prealbumin-like fold domain-containing protein [Nocardia]MBF6235498.1 hypothetical protein [Nocardia otitidiscaviarum]
MRTTLIVTAAAALAMVPVSAAAEGPGDNTLRVSAVHAADRFPIEGVTADVSDCLGGPVLATVTTGANGAGSFGVAPGCYRVQLTSTPAGCTLDGEPAVQLAVIPGMVQTADYRFRCA